LVLPPYGKREVTSFIATQMAGRPHFLINELFIEFTRYLITHPEFGEDLPKGSEVILLDRKDPGYTNYMLKRAPKKDAIFIDVGKLAPIRSRLRKPKIISRPPARIAG
jgi:hypothetical protein